MSESTKGYDSLAGLVNELTMLPEVDSVIAKEQEFKDAFRNIPVSEATSQELIGEHRSFDAMADYNFMNHGFYNENYYPVQEIHFD